jgi:hypothetical protein
MGATRAQLMWPPEKVGTGPALGKQAVADRLGIPRKTLEGRLNPDRRARAPHPFPIEDGWAFQPADGDPTGTDRLAPVPYWFERTVVAYGIAVGDLDSDGRTAEQAKAATAEQISQLNKRQGRTRITA